MTVKEGAKKKKKKELDSVFWKETNPWVREKDFCCITS